MSLDDHNLVLEHAGTHGCLLRSLLAKKIPAISRGGAATWRPARVEENRQF